MVSGSTEDLLGAVPSARKGSLALLKGGASGGCVFIKWIIIWLLRARI